jgi:heme-degrading monooxygenase HmoA
VIGQINLRKGEKKMSIYVNMIASKCRPQDEERFIKWWAEVHIPLLLKFKGLKSVTRYKLATDDKNAAPYIAIQEFSTQADMEAFEKSPELATAREEMKKAWPDSDSWKIIWRATYEKLDSFAR